MGWCVSKDSYADKRVLGDHHEHAEIIVKYKTTDIKSREIRHGLAIEFSANFKQGVNFFLCLTSTHLVDRGYEDQSGWVTDQCNQV